MNYKKQIAVLGFSAFLLSVPVQAYAHEDKWDGNGNEHHCGHNHHRLSEDQRERLHTAMKQAFEKDKPVFHEMRKLREQERDILDAQTFDKDAYMSLEDKVEHDRDQLAHDRAAAFASIADKFTPEERKHIAWKMKRHHRHHHRHHHYDHEGQDRHEWHHHEHHWSDEGHQSWKDNAGSNPDREDTAN